MKMNFRKYISRFYLIFLSSLCLVSPIIGSEEQISNYETFDTPIWHDCGGSNWYQGSDTDYENVLRSGPIECTGVSRICTNVTGPAKISFWWKSDVANKMLGQLSFIVDDTIYICDSTGWVPISYLIWDNETHELTWEFRKIRCYPKNVGAGWIGDLYIEYRDSTIPHSSKTPISEPIKPSSNISILPAGITIFASEVVVSSSNVTMALDNVIISPKNVTMSSDEVTISPKNLTMNPDEVTISPKNVTMSSDEVTISPKNFDGVTISPRNVTMSTDQVGLFSRNIIDIVLPSDPLYDEINNITYVDNKLKPEPDKFRY